MHKTEGKSEGDRTAIYCSSLFSLGPGSIKEQRARIATQACMRL